jgi:hypothetical protein
LINRKRKAVASWAKSDNFYRTFDEKQRMAVLRAEFRSVD